MAEMGLDALDEMDGVNTEVEADEKKKTSDAEARAAVKQTIMELEKIAVEDPTFLETRRSLTNSVEVLNSLGWGNKNGLVDATDAKLAKAIKEGDVKLLPDDAPVEDCVVTYVDGVIKGATKRNTSGASKKSYVVPTNISRADAKPLRCLDSAESQIVGYILKNIGSTPINYITAVCSKDESGKYIEQEVQATMAPGEVIQLTRKYTAMLGVTPEFSLKFANGALTGKVPANASIDEALSRQYFSLSDSSTDVHSPDFKLQIGDPVMQNGKEHYVVSAEYVDTFGFLNNVVTAASTPKRAKAEGNKFDKYDIKAFQLLTKLQESGRL